MTNTSIEKLAREKARETAKKIRLNLRLQEIGGYPDRTYQIILDAMRPLETVMEENADKLQLIKQRDDYYQRLVDAESALEEMVNKYVPFRSDWEQSSSDEPEAVACRLLKSPLNQTETAMRPLVEDSKRKSNPTGQDLSNLSGEKSDEATSQVTSGDAPRADVAGQPKGNALQDLSAQNLSYHRDSKRLDLLERAFEIRKSKRGWAVLMGFTNYEYDLHPTLRAACDNALNQTETKP